MTIQEMQDRKKELGLSNEFLSQMTGIPVPTLQKIFSGTTKAPRQSTIQALEQALSRRMPGYVAEPPSAYGTRERNHTIEEIYALPDGVRAELIDGRIYYMATPTRIHQEINGELHLAVANYIRAHNGSCKVYIPPFAVFLFGDESTYVEPDLTVICDPSKLDDRGCVGAPDWVIEILSPSSSRMDCILKLFKYRTAGVREYWIVDPEERRVIAYLFDTPDRHGQVTLYTFEDSIPCSLYPDLKIRLADTV